MGEPLKAVKLTFMGCAGVGKSTLLNQFLTKEFEIKNELTLEDPESKMIKLPDYAGNITPDSPQIAADVIDTAEDFMNSYPPSAPGIIRISDGFAIVYSITGNYSFEKVKEYLELIHNTKDFYQQDEMAIMLVANKMDLESDRVVPSSAGREFASTNNMLYAETS
eukprot:Phypoly_transcript_22759.p1 GENE.Phypoly_transcript_22759~~Phypoly_transcript_22759.p1  ORF type:complete len:176 (+),score=27.66 Phypoly_transcript_22759:35-529(+)